MESYKAEFKVDSQWCDNALRFATKTEAGAYAVNLFQRWTMPTDKRVVESEDPVNYVADKDGNVTAVEKSNA